ncbi:xanthine dehydrogenase family protein molybdopterin-binding subunit [Halorussus litoreus]|uniref:xanthine dehydrogenase family protein molybdopterin-binding subunit n=1 Tax=Halorussus litoreus TaxID=1710536 RepID=UPI000E2545FB|nr:xanthine dehydrogenase family protein molybdopterin-binding subunit [Halorussus litoreus]
MEDRSVTGDESEPTGIGAETPRREDEPLLTGEAEYTDDLSAPGMVHLAFVRSEHGHARIESVDTGSAASCEGVLGVYTWDDIAASDAPGVLPIATSRLDCDPPGHPVLAGDRVRYHGQPVAAVVAESRAGARDAAEAVAVEYAPLDAVVDPEAATDPDAPTIFESAPDNVAVTSEQGDREATDEAFADADRAVEVELENNRLIASALEPRAALARWKAGDDQLAVEMTSQSPHGHRRKLSTTLGLPENKIRVISPSVGGGFGHKGHHYPGEAMAGWTSRELDRPVKWTATRSENYLAGAHGRDHRTTAEIAVDDDGTIRGLRAETHAGVGGYGLGGGPAMPGWYGRLLSSQYRIPAIHCETKALFTNTAPVHSYRGAGRPEAIYVTERLVTAAARELDLDPAELRRRNLLGPDDFPYQTPVGAEYDSGDYEPALDAALDELRTGNSELDAGSDELDYESLRSTDRDDEGRFVGVGLACFVESTGGGFESGVVRVHPDGGVTAYAGTHSHGQGHGTTYAQIVGEALGVADERIEVVEGDTEPIPQGTGTFGSRSTIVGGNAVAEAAEAVREKAECIAAGLLSDESDGDGDGAVSREDVTVDAGQFRVAGNPGLSCSFEEVASAAYGRGRPEGVEPGLEATSFYEPDGTAYAFGTHAAAVAVDPETGELDIERYVAVDDCGERVNPTIVEGQVHGGVAQGIGQARSEHAVYEADGTLATTHLTDYAVPRAAHLPEFETESTVTPSPRNPLGVKGIGEAGTIAAPPAVVNAVVDALAPLAVRHLDMPLTDETIWRAIEDARE